MPQNITVGLDSGFAPLTPADSADVLAFILAYKTETGKTVAPEDHAAIETTIKAVLAAADSYGYVCREAGKLVGYMILHLANFPMLGGREAYISELFITKPMRGRGIGRKFLALAERLARSRDCVRLMLNNPKDSEGYMRSFYLKQGFEERTGFANFIKNIVR